MPESQPCRIVVINLDRDEARLAHISAELEQVGLTFDRFAAIDGADLPGWLKHYLAKAPATLTRGEIGCYASHLAVCRDVAARDAPALVLEDDVALPPNLPLLLTRLLAVLPRGWDMVRLSYPSKRATALVAPLVRPHELVRYTHVPTSTGAYLLSPSGARKFLGPPIVRGNPVDHDLRRVWAWRLSAFGVSPPPVVADAFGTSSIDAAGARAQNGWRRSRMRWQRRLESVDRLRQGMRDFGAGRWLLLEAANMVAALLPRAWRQRLHARRAKRSPARVRGRWETA
ncbi:glycosyltransferase family 25 protein [Terricaulis sp.]|uniref:glycosyltransferase family 25 protein n=1 Tax=Terricaulis sp. TaxID=2768686 RepID=UPI0037836831